MLSKNRTITCFFLWVNDLDVRKILAIIKQITGETVGEVRPVADMHQRKAEMARHSDCFIALPGLSLSLL